MVSVVSIPDVCLLAYFYNNSWKMLCVFYFYFYSYSFLLYDNIFPNTKFVRYSDILLKKHKLHLSHLFCCNHTCCCINMVSVTSASRYIMSVSRYHPRYQIRSSMYISGPIPRISQNCRRQFRSRLNLWFIFLFSLIYLKMHKPSYRILCVR